MELTRISVVRKINEYSLTNDKVDLIHLLCEMLDDENFIFDNLDLIKIAIEIGELYGYNEYLKKYEDNIQMVPNNLANSVLRKAMFTSKYDNNIIFNSGQLSLLEEINMYNRVFISAPTSFGKTSLIFEHIYSHYHEYNNICIIVPTNSLQEELFNKFLQFNKKINRKYTVLTSALSIKGNCLYILTPEKYLLLNEHKEETVFDLIIIDESYKIEELDENYGSQLEDSLNSRSSKYRMVFELCCNMSSKLIFLSPYTYNKNESMLEFFNKYNIISLDRTYNYVNHQIEDVSTKTKACRVLGTEELSFNSDSGGLKKAVAILPHLNENTIVYIRFPSEISQILSLINIKSFNLETISNRFKSFISHLESNYTLEDSSWYVLDALKKGVGLYVSPIPRYIKKEIVDLFNEGQIKVLIVTTAFAEGVNSSARNIIITNETAGGNRKLSNLDLLNLSGRAGRFGKYSKGYIYTVRKETYEKLIKAESDGVSISNSNYEFPMEGTCRSDYEIDIIDNKWLSVEEIEKKKMTEQRIKDNNLSFDDLKIALCTSNNTKLLLYEYFSQLQIEGKNEERFTMINNLLSKDRMDVLKSLEYVFNELRSAGIPISSDIGDVVAYSKDGTFLWGKFYAIHSSGNIKSILKNRKKYIISEYNSVIRNFDLSTKTIKEVLNNNGKKWMDNFITEGKIDDFKLYNQTFKFISNIIEYRIPFYIGLYASIFKLYSEKNGLGFSFDFSVVDISTSLENKVVAKEYSNMIEFGLPLDMVNKLLNHEELDSFEKEILEDYKKVYE